VRIFKHPEAKLDLLQHFVYIGQHNRAAAERFLRTVESEFEKLAAMPGMGPVRDFGQRELEGMRSWPVGRYRKYVIFYRPTEAGIEVFRVLHGMRELDRIFRTS
jgi:toxin ParE1/3/4